MVVIYIWTSHICTLLRIYFIDPSPLKKLPPYLSRARRSYGAYYYNYLDEIAMSVCAALPTDGPGLMYAVRRTCGTAETCEYICTESALREQAPTEVQSLTWSCVESLHVYKSQPTLADNYEEYTDSKKLGLAVYRHHSCTDVGCGPNYCCCRAA